MFFCVFFFFNTILLLICNLVLSLQILDALRSEKAGLRLRNSHYPALSSSVSSFIPRCALWLSLEKTLGLRIPLELGRRDVSQLLSLGTTLPTLSPQAQLEEPLENGGNSPFLVTTDQCCACPGLRLDESLMHDGELRLHGPLDSWGRCEIKSLRF